MKNNIEAAARKALIAADPAYHSWTPAQQEQFRATLTDDADTRIRQVLLASLLNISCKLEQVNEAWKNVPLSHMNALNWAALLASGIGDDYIYLNESMAEGKNLLDFPTLYDYDYDDYLFQESANHKEFTDYEARDYYAFRHVTWARLLMEQEFYYANVLSLATHIGHQIEEVGDDHIRTLIPQEYVDGKDHGKRVKDGFTWDMKVDAAGKEGQLDELKSRWHAYQVLRWQETSQAFDDQPPAVFFVINTTEPDLNCSFIFRNAGTLKQIRWKHFLADCAPLTKRYEEVAKWISAETQKAKQYLDEQHRDIAQNFDPTISKFKKKRKIVMTDQAMEDIEKIRLDEDDRE